MGEAAGPWKLGRGAAQSRRGASKCQEGREGSRQGAAGDKGGEDRGSEVKKGLTGLNICSRL